jgi:hypothetical protein
MCKHAAIKGVVQQQNGHRQKTYRGQTEQTDIGTDRQTARDRETDRQ